MTGFNSKREAAADKLQEPVHCQCIACKDGILHASDCAVHNGPAYPAGPCDCGVAQEQDWKTLPPKDAPLVQWAKGQTAPPKRTEPAQEPVECLDCGSHNVGIPATYDSLVDSVKEQPAQEPVAYEREQCAKMVDHILKYGGGTYGDAIRARSKT